jgi:DNA-binding transcriptional MerR regulator/methylmalonyl-CoA mutase cobalamin-binding subunit
MPDFAGLNIAAVERDTGLSKDTLRVWERRYGFPKPVRDSLGERLYSAAEVEKLRCIKRLLDQGYRPGKLIGASDDELARLIESFADIAAEPRELSPEISAIFDMVKLHRSDELRGLLTQALMKQGLQQFVSAVVVPLNQRIGEGWVRGEIEVMEEHLYTELLQNTLRSAINAYPLHGKRPRVLLTTLPGEEHTLGLLMAEAMLVPEGVQCISLGIQTPISDIQLAARSGNFDVVALSFSAAYSARRAVEGLVSLRSRLPEAIELWAGGAGVRDPQRRLAGTRIIAGIDDTLSALQEWRAARMND